MFGTYIYEVFWTLGDDDLDWVIIHSEWDSLVGTP